MREKGKGWALWAGGHRLPGLLVAQSGPSWIGLLPLEGHCFALYQHKLHFFLSSLLSEAVIPKYSGWCI